MTVAVGGATFAMGMPGQIGLELIEESPAPLVLAQRGEPVADRRALSGRFDETVLDEGAHGVLDGRIVGDEAEEIRQGRVRPKAWS